MVAGDAASDQLRPTGPRESSACWAEPRRMPLETRAGVLIRYLVPGLWQNRVVRTHPQQSVRPKVWIETRPLSSN